MFGETKWGEQHNVVASMEAVDFILVQGFRVSSELEMKELVRDMHSEIDDARTT